MTERKQINMRVDEAFLGDVDYIRRHAAAVPVPSASDVIRALVSKEADRLRRLEERRR